MTSNRNHPPKHHPPHLQEQANPKQRRIQTYTHGKYAEESAVGTPVTSSTTAAEANAAANATDAVDGKVAASSVGSTTDVVGTANVTNVEFVGTADGTASTNNNDVTSNNNNSNSTANNDNNNDNNNESTASSVTTQQTPARRPYPLQPSTLQAATSYSLFSDPQAFALPTIYNRTHYLHTSLRGKLWWDVNGDGKRGDYVNVTLNELEYDYGVSNVPNVVLVSCHDEDDYDESVVGDGGGGGSVGSGPVKLASATSAPFNGRDAMPLSQSLVAQAGIYDFMQMDTIPSGRYYVMYEAPRGWRLTGNVLPLERREMNYGEGGGSYECIPRGGNGVTFSDMARQVGDFDQYGYCARSIGCVEIGSRSELEDRFDKLELLEDTDYYKNVIQGDTEVDLYGMNGMAYTGGKMVALPTPYALDVGLAREGWELAAKQYADATVTLTFPVMKEEETMVVTPLESTLSGVFVDAESFGTSVHQKTVGKVLEKYVKENIVNLASGGNIHKKRSKEAVFDLSGIDLFDAKMERKTKNNRDASDSLGRYLRGSRNAQENEEVIEITYSFTARGSYNVRSNLAWIPVF
ncbi:hypothetical protein HJC23_002843 [Cyclotella cryptica]|uniref:Uncharacterized protein n=1 Tax=Cyclotella cryptica TaxID=29204 RepID=A0ABD3P688_9STRA